MNANDAIATVLEQVGEFERDVTVEVSYQVVKLLSDQLYSSALKAIEELVVNAWDADARTCRIYVPPAEAMAAADTSTFIAVYDDGQGMSASELEDLWHVGVSHKRDESWTERVERRQIGKFGIGKLASYAIAHQVTYVSRSDGGTRGVTLDFDEFERAADATGAANPIRLQMRRIPDLSQFGAIPRVQEALEALGLAREAIDGDHWTLVILERLKPKVSEIRRGRLRWVLSTAMPLASDFDLRLNDERIESSKRNINFIVTFGVHEITPERLKSVENETREKWRVDLDGQALVSSTFPNGIIGEVMVADRSLYAASAKSEDLGRSHGFFIRVRKRLINEGDPLFGLKPLSFTTFYHFAAEINADDLDAYLKAPRDDIEQTDAKVKLRVLLDELFRQARELYEAKLRARVESEKRKNEGDRDYVNPRLVERPVADAVVSHREHGEQPRAWRYVDLDVSEDAIQQLVEDLYTDTPRRRQYKYHYTGAGRASLLVKFNPDDSSFYLNEDHELVIEYRNSPIAKRLLELVATSEALLEVYLRDVRIPDLIVDQVLERRDQLLRSLTNDELLSLSSLAGALRAATDDERDLEVAIVGAVRAFGFVAEHISGAGEPDGLASYAARGLKGKSFTLEAKSSQKVPSLGQLDFAGLRSHWEQHGANGCMLVAPSYPGSSRDEESEVARRAKQQSVSCWTVDQLAHAVELAEARHISADDVQEIVLNAFTPSEVEREVEKLLATPVWNKQELNRKIVRALGRLEAVMPNTARDVSMVAATVALDDGFATLERSDVEDALRNVASGSKGILHITDDGSVVMRGSLAELERRTNALTGDDVEPRRRGQFRDGQRDG
jgi:hypothetical protein